MFQQLNRFQQGGTLYDYLKSTGRKGSAAYNQGRKALAEQFGIENYSGTAEQNIQLLNHLHARDGVDSLYPDLPSRTQAPVRRTPTLGGSPMMDSRDIPAEERNSYPKHNVRVNTPSSPTQTSSRPSTLAEFLKATPNTTTNRSNAAYISASNYGDNNNANRMDKNQQYASENGMRFDPATGNVNTLFNANSKGYNLFHNAGDVTGDAINLASILDGAGAAGALGKQGFKQVVKAIGKGASTKVNPALIANMAKGIRGEVAGAINEVEGMSPALQNIWNKQNYAELPLNSQRQANTITEQLLRNADAKQEMQGIATHGIKTNNFGNLPRRAQKIALQQKIMNSLEPMYQQGGVTPRRVDTVPDGFNPLRVDGNRSYYNKLGSNSFNGTASASGARASNDQSYMQGLAQRYPGVDGNSLQQRGFLSSDGAKAYGSYYKPTEDVVYTERQPQQPSSSPAQAARGLPVYDGQKHISAELFYPTRDSMNESQGGALNTQNSAARLKFRNDFGYTGEEIDMAAPDIQKYLGTSNTFQTNDGLTELRNRAKSTLAIKRKGGWVRNKNPYS